MDLNFDQDIRLENERALLRPIEENDFDHLLPAALSDKNLLQYSPAPIHSEALLKKYIENALKERKACFRYAFSIYDKQAQAYAGSSSFANISNKDQRLEIGWTWLGKNFQRTGLNRQCKLLMLQYAFETLAFERVELKTDERNLQSRAAIEQIGGKMEGIFRSHTVMYDGFRRNTVYFSILKSEWQEVKQKLQNDSSRFYSLKK